MSIYNLLAFAGALPAWVTNSFPIIRKVIIGLIGVAAIALIIIVLCQSSSSSGGTNVLSGEIESYYAQNKGRSREGRLKMLTIVMASCIAGLTILYFILTAIYAG